MGPAVQTMHSTVPWGQWGGVLWAERSQREVCSEENSLYLQEVKIAQKKNTTTSITPQPTHQHTRKAHQQHHNNTSKKIGKKFLFHCCFCCRERGFSFGHCLRCRKKPKSMSRPGVKTNFKSAKIFSHSALWGVIPTSGKKHVVFGGAHDFFVHYRKNSSGPGSYYRIASSLSL